MKTETYMGRDQYGQYFHDLGPHPRKELLHRLGYTKASRMFIDKQDGSYKHIGYVIGPHWIRLYEVSPFEKAA